MVCGRSGPVSSWIEWKQSTGQYGPPWAARIGLTDWTLVNARSLATAGQSQNVLFLFYRADKFLRHPHLQILTGQDHTLFVSESTRVEASLTSQIPQAWLFVILTLTEEVGSYLASVPIPIHSVFELVDREKLSKDRVSLICGIIVRWVLHSYEGLDANDGDFALRGL
ncbi:hypothetical protein BXZ70DRAFT_1011140 [Cristinia sonorae]|uniref:Uncharacterized protein n=1 Tax=Cristinia sonorae TaxID=1940300 RepID=A0A8K0XLS8_9AGAR|nr:hypothetical protein BXZ70DRAFT_1011140 [Cristinia sonorae]